MLLERASVGDCVADRFELQRRLRTNKDMAIFSARDRAEGTDVIVKLVHAVEPDTDVVARLRGLRHAAMVPVLTVERGDDGTLIVVTGHVSAASLHVPQLVATLGPADIAKGFASLADAVEEAHRAGVVHGHIKPSQIEVVPLQDGEVRLRLTGWDAAIYPRRPKRVAHDIRDLGKALWTALGDKTAPQLRVVAKACIEGRFSTARELAAVLRGDRTLPLPPPREDHRKRLLIGALIGGGLAVVLLVGLLIGMATRTPSTPMVPPPTVPVDLPLPAVAGQPTPDPASEPPAITMPDQLPEDVAGAPEPGLPLLGETDWAGRLGEQAASWRLRVEPDGTLTVTLWSEAEGRTAMQLFRGSATRVDGDRLSLAAADPDGQELGGESGPQGGEGWLEGGDGRAAWTMQRP